MISVVDCCLDPYAPPAVIGDFPFGADFRGLCCVCGRGKTLPHEWWCPGVAASLHRRNHHPTLKPLYLEHGTVEKFTAGCHCMRCVRAWLRHVEQRR